MKSKIFYFMTIAAVVGSLSTAGCITITAPQYANISNGRYLQSFMAGVPVMQTDARDEATCKASLDVALKNHPNSANALKCVVNSVAGDLPVKTTLLDEMTGIEFETRFKTLTLCNKTIAVVKTRPELGARFTKGCT